MTIDPSVIPGLLLLAAELLALAAVGFVVARVALRQDDDRLALASGLVIGPALWGLIVNFVLHLFPGLAGALAGWMVLLALGAGLAWRRRTDLRLPGRTLAGFAGAGTAIFWIALASRQLLIIPDHLQHTLIPATIRAGNWPPRLPWNPDLNLAYHYGVDLLAGLLTPPTGPDLSFTTEVLGAYVWASLILLVGTLLLRHGSWLGTLTAMPLLLAAGAWTLVFGDQPSVLQIPVPGGIPEGRFARLAYRPLLAKGGTAVALGTAHRTAEHLEAVVSTGLCVGARAAGASLTSPTPTLVGKPSRLPGWSDSWALSTRRLPA